MNEIWKELKENKNYFISNFGNWFKSFNVNTTPIEYKHLFGRFYYYTFTINYEKKSN